MYQVSFESGMLHYHLGSSTLPVSVFFILGALWVVWNVLSRLSRPSPLDNVPGPEPISQLTGCMKGLFSRQGWTFLDQLDDTYGGVSKLDGMFGAKILYIFDPLALQHIFLKDTHSFDETQWFLASNMLTFGPGLLGTHGSLHRKQRKMLNPVFSINHMRHMSPIFYRVVHKLRDAVASQVMGGPRDLDMHERMGRTALELIGQGALGYSFDPLTEVAPNRFADAIKAYMLALFGLGPLRFYAQYAKYLGPSALRRKMVEYSPLKNLRNLGKAVYEIKGMSEEILESKKEALAAGDEVLLQQIGEGKDIMSILLKANIMASEEDRLSDDELVSQMSTFIFAGTDTTSSAIVQALGILSEHPEAQERLRAEIKAVTQDGVIPFDDLAALPYMDAICRETLRLYPPVSFIFREAQSDTVLPFSKPVRGRDGEMMTEVPVLKGTHIVIAIRSSNRNKALWGEDALEWKPERWLSPLPQAVLDARIPGLYSNLMTFGGGGRACIGFKFAQMELKINLSVLLASFKFSPADNKDDVVWNLGGLRYPTIGLKSNKPCFPLKVERLEL